MVLKRRIAAEFEEYLDLFPATGILGPRQVGKTTLAKQVAQTQAYLYLDLEQYKDREKLKTDPAFFLLQFADKCVILDEVQFMPKLFGVLRGIIDADRRPGRFVLLGSAAPDIIRGSAACEVSQMCLQ